ESSIGVGLGAHRPLHHEGPIDSDGCGLLHLPATYRLRPGRFDSSTLWNRVGSYWLRPPGKKDGHAFEAPGRVCTFERAPSPRRIAFKEQVVPLLCIKTHPEGPLVHSRPIPICWTARQDLPLCPVGRRRYDENGRALILRHETRILNFLPNGAL